MSYYFRHSSTIATTRWQSKSLIYTQWPSRSMHGLWMKIEESEKYLCIYQQNINTKISAICSSILKHGDYHNIFNDWRKNNFTYSLSANELYDNVQHLCPTPTTQINLLNKLFLRLYIDFCVHLVRIDDIRLHDDFKPNVCLLYTYFSLYRVKNTNIFRNQLTIIIIMFIIT